jgi:hypothetical protein
MDNERKHVIENAIIDNNRILDDYGKKMTNDQLMSLLDEQEKLFIELLTLEKALVERLNIKAGLFTLKKAKESLKLGRRF